MPCLGFADWPGLFSLGFFPMPLLKIFKQAFVFFIGEFCFEN
jgi:hypothetical protein